MQGAIADRFVQAVIQIDGGRERQIDTMRAQLSSHQPAHGAGRMDTRRPVRIEQLPDAARGRQAGESAAEALHPATLMIDGNEQGRTAHRVDAARQLQQLLGVCIIAREQDDATDERMREHVALFRQDRKSYQVDHQWPECHIIVTLAISPSAASAMPATPRAPYAETCPPPPRRATQSQIREPAQRCPGRGSPGDTKCKRLYPVQDVRWLALRLMLRRAVGPAPRD